MTTTLRKKSAFCVAVAVALFLSLFGDFGRTQGVTNSVWLIPIETEITTATAQFVASRVERANNERPLALVFYLDTPGGQIIAAERIVNSILQESQVPTLSVVSNAISAGAIIAMSAEQVAMLPGSSIGAATAINAFTGENAGEKINSVWRNQFRSVAEARGRNADVAEGMVSERIEIPGLSTDQELITLSAAQAVEYDIADIQANNLTDALEKLGYGGVTVERLEPNLAERLGGSLANPLIAAALLVLGIGGILIEAFSPGFGIPGVIGIVALVALGAGAFIATPAGMLDMVLIFAGVLLLVLELLVIPGFGVAGVLGLAAIVIAIIRIFPNNNQWAYVLGYTAIFGAILTFFLFWMLPNSRFVRVFALNTRLANTPGMDSQSARLVASYDYLLGQRGVALSDLRPAGVARINNERKDVVTEGDFIANGAEIEVILVEGSRIVVKAVANA
ncbi:MAG: ATP-dependent Clp protease proteolytic subunit [Trueperaceae bacterium]|nr:ATP-dependent Clp protease proteolytic subunit [Trueperaceae bacterium]